MLCDCQSGQPAARKVGWRDVCVYSESCDKKQYFNVWNVYKKTFENKYNIS